MPPEKVETGRVAPLPQPDHPQHLLHPRRHELRLDPVELAVELQVLLGGQVAVERRSWKTRPMLRRTSSRSETMSWPATVALPDVGFDQRAQHVDRRRLAGAVGAEEAEDLAGLHLEIDAANRPHLAKGLDEVADGDRGRRCAAVRR